MHRKKLKRIHLFIIHKLQCFTSTLKLPTSSSSSSSLYEMPISLSLPYKYGIHHFLPP